MMNNSQNLSNLKTLTLSEIKLSPSCVKPLGEAIKGLHRLEFLNLSANGLRGNEINEFLTIINRLNCLKSIDLSYNSVKQLAIT